MKACNKLVPSRMIERGYGMPIYPIYPVYALKQAAVSAVALAPTVAMSKSCLKMKMEDRNVETIDCAFGLVIK